MSHLILDRMWDRIDNTRQDSDTSLFYDLSFACELLTKTVTAALIAAVTDDRERHRYRQLYHVVRADGLGDWVSALDEVLLGLTAKFLTDQAREEQRELTQRVPVGNWQYEAVKNLHSVLRLNDEKFEELPTKVDARRWFSYSAVLRNITRAHGAPLGGLCAKCCVALEKSIHLVADNFCLFKRPWVFLFRNLSGKYRVTSLGGDTSPFNYLKTTSSASFAEGVYVLYNEPTLVELIQTDSDTTDFFFPNGNFRERKFEKLSYHTGSKVVGDAAPYLSPAGALPPSETQGIGILDAQGRTFANLPTATPGYVRRPELERELLEALLDDRHPIITIRGGGGIGKTSAALQVLHDVTAMDRFDAIIWFSARDLDLLPEGPKPVKPQVLTEEDIADEFARLMQPSEMKDRDFSSTTYMAKCMFQSPIKGSLLFVFDNFETVRNPVEIFNWIDTSIRNPNKALITTRRREFNPDYHVEVGGMTEAEAEMLINGTSSRLGIEGLLTQGYRNDLYQESGGHPYVLKVLLGEVAKAQRLVSIERIVAAKEDMLDALFERTYLGLSPAARRVFLTLCGWRSSVPRVALEAVLLRPANERIDVERAIEELIKSSFAETIISPEDSMEVLSVPLAASIFGRKKIEVSPLKSAIESDTTLLRTLGAAQSVDMKQGIMPRIDRLFGYVAGIAARNSEELGRHAAMLEFIARHFHPAWLRLASLYEESALPGSLERAKEALRNYIGAEKNSPAQRDAWERLSRICYRTGDYGGEIHARIEMSKSPDAPYSIISDAANKANGLFKRGLLSIAPDEKQAILMELAQLMESRTKEADATDLSRLGWIYLQLHDDVKARHYTKKGLELDPNNEHCLGLAERLRMI